MALESAISSEELDGKGLYLSFQLSLCPLHSGLKKENVDNMVYYTLDLRTDL